MPFWQRHKTEAPLRNPKTDIAEQGVVFRRSRTLTGTASSNISSANESRSQIKSPRLKEHELKKHRRRLGVSLFGCFALIGGCVWLLDQYIVQANTIASQQVLLRPLDHTRYQKALDDYLAAHPAEHFRFLLDEKKLSEYFQDKLPEVATVSIDGGEGLVATEMTLLLRVPVAVWQVSNTRYYVDATGVTYEKNYYPDPPVSVKDESGISPESTELVASSRLLRFLGQTVAGINTAGIGSVSKVVIPGGTLRQLDFYLDSRPYRIKTQMDREAAGQVSDAVNAVRYFDSKQITPEYIDVRVKSKAFYR